MNACVKTWTNIITLYKWLKHNSVQVGIIQPTICSCWFSLLGLLPDGPADRASTLFHSILAHCWKTCGEYLQVCTTYLTPERNHGVISNRGQTQPDQGSQQNGDLTPGFSPQHMPTTILAGGSKKLAFVSVTAPMVSTGLSSSSFVVVSANPTPPQHNKLCTTNSLKINKLNLRKFPKFFLYVNRNKFLQYFHNVAKTPSKIQNKTC